MPGFGYIVPPSLLLSPTSRKTLQTAAWFSKLFLILLVMVGVWTGPLEESPATTVLLAVMFVGAMSTATIVILMELYWFKFDKNPKIFWFLFISLAMPVGALAYFYAVYLKQTTSQAPPEEQAMAATHPS